MAAVSRLALSLALALFLALFPALSVSAQITIAPENRCSPYARDDYDYPQSIEARIIAENLWGQIISPYTGEVFSGESQTDIEHIVAISEAHDSGLCAAPAETKKQFGQDLHNLTLASPSLNSQKGAKDLAEWRPERSVCWFAQTVAQVKAKYQLSMDLNEASAAIQILQLCAPREQCRSLDLADKLNCYAGWGASGPATLSTTLSASPAQEPTESAEASPESDGDALALYDDNENGRITCAEARYHGIAPVKREHPAYPFMDDRNNDGVVCE